MAGLAHAWFCRGSRELAGGLHPALGGRRSSDRPGHQPPHPTRGFCDAARQGLSFNVEGSNRLYTGKVLLYMGELRDYTDHEDDFCGSSAPEYQAWFTTGTEADTAPENYFVVHFSHDNTWQHMSLGEIHSALMAGRLTAFKESSAGALYMKLTSERYLFASYLVSDVRAVTKQCSMAFPKR